MKSVILKANKKINLEESKISKLKDNQCLVKISYVGICSSDIYRSFEGWAYKYPLVMGHEISGKVVKKKNINNDIKIGDKVSIFPLLPCFKCKQCRENNFMRCVQYGYYGSRNDGGFAEYIVVNSWNLLKIPKNVDLLNASLIEPLAVVIHAYKKVNLDKNKAILLLGSGFLSLIFQKIIRFYYPNLYIYVVDRNNFKLQLAKKYTSKIKTLNINKKINLDNFFKNNKNNFDIIIETTGDPKFYKEAINLSAPNGEILLLSNIINDLKLSKKLVSNILRKELKIRGTWNSYFKKSSKIDDWKESISLIKKGIKPSELVTKIIKLSDIPTYLKKMHNHKTKRKRINYVKFVSINND